LAPSLGLTNEDDELPFSVKPEKKVSVRDVMKFYRETYEGTPYDMTANLKRQKWAKNDSGKWEVTDTVKSPIANPWMSSDHRGTYNMIEDKTVERFRTIAIAGCSYSQVIQLRSWLPDEIGALAWFSFDNPAQSPRIPIYAGTLNLPESFHIGNQHRFREDAAAWTFRRANRLATVKWQKGRKMVEESVMEFEERLVDELPYIEKRALEILNSGDENAKQKAQEYLTRYTHHNAYAAKGQWQELGDHFWQMFGRWF